ncbi:MAG: dihydrodipicolinate synthase family protein [Alphaproteobacteria bacterium]|nr:dihydrodipicolinate synthase family protein [Alphaproteobacteria bacterium]
MTMPEAIAARLAAGTAIPAHPLALTAQRTLDATRQRALTRYYLDAGAGGLAVGVHTTQFAIRERGLYRPVLEVAAQTTRDWTTEPIALVAGVSGPTEQALREADLAAGLGYHAGLLSLAALKGAREDAILDHCRQVARVIPLFGFYLQPAVGGVVLSADFWRRFCEIEGVVAIKMAPFNRYRTLDVVRGLVAAHAECRITLYTGNDDHILLDLLTPYRVRRGGDEITVRIKGGLLGHWSFWTQKAVALLERAHRAVQTESLALDLLTLDAAITDSNGAMFDVANDFAGCIAGCHEVLRRQGLLDGIWCLDPAEGLGPGQAAEIDRVYRDYPELNDDAFVRANAARWLA